MSDIRETFYVGHTSDGSLKKRPMSPHLQVYKPIPSMTLSILNRVTGAALSFGSAIMVVWLASAAKGPKPFKKVQKLTGSFPGQLVLFGFSVSFFLHFIRGIRHLVWDSTAKRLEKEEINKDSKIDIISITALTLGLWTIIIGKRLRKKKK
ncbi:succinate dehydrogenase, cytochrome b556 subunit [Commensalibacter papalotli (ex Botero et al. 2024)]|uniref:succinate dehydrogenase, cytochrome b556 subunit n=1 Tax=Commensalibacter papalotli (ex Botero et al. 2024) TaxID=2972766 RepID=UPI0022FF5ADA|nr:succinate dehydrogenase, cytochrome b556 subunit [Commensalibacter papalotli (ex Botero et al. 2024)]CAI3944184.1 Succinate dehydrogenase/fumarate reductase [Commensalibacter papalotli (ex Botero et al. 2024)]